MLFVSGDGNALVSRDGKPNKIQQPMNDLMTLYIAICLVVIVVIGLFTAPLLLLAIVAIQVAFVWLFSPR